VARFQPLCGAIGTSREADAADAVYGTLPSINFSEHVLVPGAARLGTVRVKGVEWSDLGNVERVYATIRRTGGHRAGSITSRCRRPGDSHAVTRPSHARFDLPWARLPQTTDEYQHDLRSRLLAPCPPRIDVTLALSQGINRQRTRAAKNQRHQTSDV